MAKLRPFSVIDKEAPRMIHRLINFLGHAAVEKALEKYNKALQTSGPILREHYTPFRHPWWESLQNALALEKSGKSLWRHLKSPLERTMIGDAYKIGVLQAKMPTSVRDKFKKDLVDDKNAWAYLFEIQIASHYYQCGYDISWYEDDGTSRPEFKVTADDFEFDVECKRISTDASRKIRRVDFYRLAEMLIPKISGIGLCGTVDIELTERLHTSTSHLMAMSDQIFQAIPADGAQTTLSFPFGKVDFDISLKSGNEVPWRELYASLEKKKQHSAHGAFFATGNDQIAKDPIEMIVAPQKTERVLSGIERRIMSASKQFDKKRPGLICCYLEGLSELSGLDTVGGLKIMTNSLLGRPDMSHILGISYCAEPRLERSGNVENFSNQGLIFKNPNCTFNVPGTVKFLS